MSINKISNNSIKNFNHKIWEDDLKVGLTGTLNCSSSNVLSYFVFGNSSASFNVGEEVFQGDKDNLILDNDNGSNSLDIQSNFLTLETGFNFVYEDNNLSLLESTIDPLNSNTGDLLLESSNSSFSYVLYSETQNTTSNGTVQEYSTDASNNKILI